MTTTERPIAAIWWRVSTKGQTELSPETQVREAREMLEAKGYQVPDQYVTGADWHSLSILDCPAMETMLRWVRHGEVQAVGMYHGDRLAGNPGQKMFIIDLCERHDVRLLSRHSPILDGKEGELLEYVRTWGKEQQVIRAQQASKDGLRDRALVKGLPPCAGAPYGYDFPLTDDGRDYSRLTPNMNWPIAQFIWQRALDGVPMRQIIRELHGRGVPTPRGKDLWAVTVIHGILHNPVYAGRYHALRRRSVAPKQRKGETYGNSSQVWKPLEDWTYLPNVTVEQPVVSWAEYLEIQARLQANKRFSRRNARRPYLLRGMILCETHQRNFQGRPREHNKGFMYVCTVVNNKIIPIDPCARKSVGGPTIEREVWDRAVDLLTNPEVILGELDRRREAQAETETSIAESLARAEKRLAANEQAEMELVSLRIRGDVSDSVYERQKSLLKAERTWLGDETERLQRQQARVRQNFVTLEQVQALRDRLGAKLEGADYEAKRFVLEALETQVVVAPDGAMHIRFAVPMPQEQVVFAAPGPS